MKKLITIIVVLICVNLSAQEKITLKNNVWVEFGIWDIPNGADTTKNKEEMYRYDINDTIVRNYFIQHPEKYIRKYIVNDTTTSYSKRKYQWQMYKNGSSQVFELREVHTVVLKQPTPSEVKKGQIINALRAKIINGYSYDDAWRWIDSVYYGIYQTKKDTIQ